MTGACAFAPVATQAPRTATTQVKSSYGVLGREDAEEVIRRLAAEGKTDLIARHIAYTETVLHSPIVVGNSARLLIDGPATYRQMFRAIDAARDHINLETYTIEAGDVGTQLADRLIARRAAGVTINLLYDSVGSISTPAAYFERLRDAGVNVCQFNPVNPLRAKSGWRVNNRDHRKILAVDGQVALVGGINISEVYSSGSFPHRRKHGDTVIGWRDTHTEIRGPAVEEVEKLFANSWARQKCSPLPAVAKLSRQPAKGGRALRIVGSGPDSEGSAMYAERSIHINVAYFAPDPLTLNALEAAARRGVDVRLVLPGVSDSWGALHAGRSQYQDLLEAGVRIFERKDTMMHAKTAVVDGVWSTIGSTNLDWRSILHNDEANVIVLDAEFGAEMERAFERDLRECVEIERAEWDRRGLVERISGWWARRWEYLL